MPLSIPLSEEGARTVYRASDLAWQRTKRTVEIADLLVCLLRLHHNDARRIVIDLGFDPDDLSCRVLKDIAEVQSGIGRDASVALSSDLNEAIDQADGAAREDGRVRVPTSYLLWAALGRNPGLAHALGIDVARLRGLLPGRRDFERPIRFRRRPRRLS